MSRLDEISPAFIGEDRFTLSVAPGVRLLDNLPITVNIDYSSAGGARALVPPLIISAQPAFGDGAGYVERTFRGNPPSTFTFRPRGAGDWLVVARESAHNKWQGRLLITVEGEKFDADEALGS